MYKTAILVAGFALLGSSSAAQATDGASHSVTINAQPSVAISVGPDVDILLSGNPGANLRGQGASTYSITSNLPDNKISAIISDPAGDYPGGVRLSVRLVRPAAGGNPRGWRRLRAGAGGSRDLVVGIPAVQENGLLVRYRARAPGSTPPTYSEAREITFTITGN